MAAAKGNQYAVKAKRWEKAIENALRKRSKTDQLEALDQVAESLVSLALSGDMAALKEIGDRLDGKAKQQTEISTPPGSAFVTRVELVAMIDDSSKD